MCQRCPSGEPPLRFTLIAVIVLVATVVTYSWLHTDAVEKPNCQTVEACR